MRFMKTVSDHVIISVIALIVFDQDMFPTLPTMLSTRCGLYLPEVSDAAAL